ncbi:MFS transporter [Streptomyces zagrosensis]|uniref:MFS family permease n=1 Tax=Streptomyces zagrosensis TaxID=1042984 RepID=A0A7W9QGM9_9ACTN|nr:MFS transporter [Streptomyces zagrosensis]MBB5939756.1 MFS family permease [Streptomyces zagrosensis]
MVKNLWGAQGARGVGDTGGGHHRRPPWYLAAAVVFAVAMAGTTVPTPLYGLYQQEIGFSELVVTVVFAAYAVGVIVALLVAGDFSDVLGRRPVLLAGLGLSAASAVCFVVEGGLPLLFVGRVLSGFSAGLFSGAGTAVVLELAPQGRRARAGLAATAANMGGLGCGPLLAGALAQYAPWPLRLPFLVHLALVIAAFIVCWALPETVTPPTSRPRLRPQGMGVPPEARAVFVPSALAAFAAFALMGLFTAVAPSFASQTLGVRNLAVTGAVVFTVFAASVAGQTLMPRLGVRRALPTGCLTLVVGLVLVALSLLAHSLLLLVAGAVAGGLGQGMAFRGALTAVSDAAPPEHRGRTISGFFVVAYGGISLPVVGVGALTLPLGLRNAGLVFSLCVVVLAASVAGYLLHRPVPESE